MTSREIKKQIRSKQKAIDEGRAMYPDEYEKEIEELKKMLKEVQKKKIFQAAYQTIIVTKKGKSKLSNVQYKSFDNDDEFEQWKMTNSVIILGITDAE